MARPRKIDTYQKEEVKSESKKVEYSLKKGIKGVAYSNDAPDGCKVIDLEHATQEQLEFLFSRNYPDIIKQ